MDLFSPSENPLTESGAATPSGSQQTPPPPEPRMEAARLVAYRIANGQRISRAKLREAMTASYGGSDAEGVWTWKDAYDAAEVAEARHLLKVGKALIAADPATVLERLESLAALQPPNRHRTEQSLALQQFSTPAPYAYAAFLAAEVRENDVLLEPSAGHGALAIFGRIGAARLILNELDTDRARALTALFRQGVHGEDAAEIDDRLRDPTRPSVVLMNPPFSKSVARGDHAAEAATHVWSAFKRLAPGGRLVAIVQHGLIPDASSHARFWQRLFEAGRLRLAAGLDGAVYARKGANVSTRLLVIDKLANDGAGGADPNAVCEAGTLDDLLEKIAALPARSGAARAAPRRIDRKPPKAIKASTATPIIRSVSRQGEKVDYKIIDCSEAVQAETDASGIYEAYRVARICIPGAKDHPTLLTQSTALASIAPPVPSYRPHLPNPLVTDGVLSDAQLESIVYAGDAHSRFMEGTFRRDPETGDVVETYADEPDAFHLRMGYFIGDGTGCGKGRQVAGIIMDNWIKGRRKAVWISKSDKLKEDAIRDWTALGGGANEIIPQSRYKLGRPISAYEGVLFTTFATLRGSGRDGKASRLDQLLEWLGDDFDGVVAFDEAHAMQNAAAVKSDRGLKAASQQGRAGVDLQLRAPGARIVYASATGASAVENLAYTERLGLWRGADAPFKSREHFIGEMNKGGVAAMEMVCRDLKAMGLYCARNLSFEGVEYAFLDHTLTPQQIEIYDSYADAFKIIHHNLEAALEAMNVVDEDGTRNRNAVSAARSAFESTKQRFFNHLLTAMKVPTLIEAIRSDMEQDRASVIQIVSTGEAVMDRRLAEISGADLREGNFDLTPREAVMDYLVNSFPTQLFHIVRKEDGSEVAEPVFDETGAPVQSQEALERREAMIERLGVLPPVTSALDQIIWTFGPEAVAEITGRRRRVIRHKELGSERVEIENRPASVNIAETNAFMDGAKRILIFSEAGGTGRSYHADLDRRNRRRRCHYLLEAGWKADAAIQGLGRSHRTRQASAPLFRPVAANVKGEKRFLSTIARRLDALGALTKGERQTGGQGLFRAEDNLESNEARDALRIFFRRIAHEPQGGISLAQFEDMTGLNLLDRDGTLKEDLPPIRRFLNRLLALPIGVQNTLFGVFEEIVETRVEAARLAGTLDVGAETITADSLKLIDAHVLRIDPKTKAETRLLRIARRTRNRPLTLETLHEAHNASEGEYVVNERSGRAAFVRPTTALTDENTGAVLSRVELIRPNERHKMLAQEFEETAWTSARCQEFERIWRKEVAATPEFSSDEFGLVVGLIMPLWSLLAAKRPIVYRLTDDDGASHLGRYIAPAMIAPLLEACGVDSAPVRLTATDALAALDRSERVPLSDGAFIAPCRVMDQQRIEVRDAPASWLPGLKACGCFTEIIQWRTRVFAPVGDAQILDRVIDRFGPGLASEAA